MNTLIPSLPHTLELTPEAVEARMLRTRHAIKDFCEFHTRENTERNYHSGIRYFWAWSWLMYGVTEASYPVSQAIIEQYVADHLIAIDPHVDKALIALGVKKKPGLYKLAHVKTRLWALSRAHQEHCSDLPKHYVYSRRVSQILGKAKHDSRNKPKQSDALTRDLLFELFDYLDKTQSPRSILLRAVIGVGFSSGGRRRGELSHFRFSDLQKTVTSEAPGWMYKLSIQHSKTTVSGELSAIVPVRGLAAKYLNDWLLYRDQAEITGGALFRAIRPDGHASTGMSDDWFYKQLVAIAEQSGLTARGLRITPHSLRAGFVTQAGREGITPGDGMAMSLHKTYSSYIRYYRAADIEQNPAGNIL